MSTDEKLHNHSSKDYSLKNIFTIKQNQRKLNPIKQNRNNSYLYKNSTATTKLDVIPTPNEINISSSTEFLQYKLYDQKRYL